MLEQGPGLPDPGLVESGSPGSRHRSTSLAYAWTHLLIYMDILFLISNLGLLTGDGRHCYTFHMSILNCVPSVVIKLDTICC